MRTAGPAAVMIGLLIRFDCGARREHVPLFPNSMSKSFYSFRMSLNMLNGSLPTLSPRHSWPRRIRVLASGGSNLITRFRLWS